ncbi:MAG: magnesium transporter [Candidatus Hydrothermarchaeales archaeon]
MVIKELEEKIVSLLGIEGGPAASILRDFKESFFALFLVTLGNLITGTIMGVSTSRLVLLPALIVLIPGAIAMRGNNFASLGSRLGTYLHTGQIDPSFRKTRILDENIFSAFFLTLLMSIYLGILASLLAGVVGIPVSIVTMATISILAGIVSAFFLLWITILIAFLSYRNGWDPDNLTSPFITLAGDMLTLPILFLAMDLVLKLPEGVPELIFRFFVVISLFGLIFSVLKASEMPYSKKILIESTPMFLIGGLLSTSSGLILGKKLGAIIGVAGLLTLIPAFLEDGGAIGGILAAKYSTGLHLGSIEYRILPDTDSIILFLFAHVLGVFIFSLIGAFAYFINIVIGLGTPSLKVMVLGSIIAGEALILIMNILVYYLSMISYKVGLDPDNVVIPLITSVMDLLGIACLVGTMMIMGII